MTYILFVILLIYLKHYYIMLYKSDLVPTCLEVKYIIYYPPFSLFTRNLLLYSFAEIHLYLSKLMMYQLIYFLRNSFFVQFFFIYYNNTRYLCRYCNRSVSNWLYKTRYLFLLKCSTSLCFLKRLNKNMIHVKFVMKNCK